MAKPIINSYEDLMEEKRRLKEGLNENKSNIKISFEALKDEVNPFSQARKTAKSALKGNSANPIVQFGIKRATEFLIGKVLLRKAGWLPRLIAPFIIRPIAERLVGRKADKKIAGALRTTADKVRDIPIPKLGEKKSKITSNT